MGRPSKFNTKICNAICTKIAEGKSVRSICSEKKMPARRTVMNWLQQHEEFQVQYTRACELRAAFWAEEIIEIADDSTNDFMERKRKDGSVETVPDHENVQRSKLRVDSRKWLMSKLVPKKYGDKLQHTGPEGDEPIQAKHILDFSELTNEQLRQLKVLAACIGSGAGES